MDEPIKILCVDDEVNVLRALERLFLDDNYEILTAPSGREGLELLRQSPEVQLVVSDYRMPEMNGVDFLREVRQNWPDTVRIVLSGYADTASIVSAINEGEIYKFIPKPWNDDELKVTISNALEHYFLHKKNQELTAELTNKNDELQRINHNLERLVAERTADLMFQNRVLTLSQNILDSLPTSVIGMDGEGMIVQCNKSGLKLLDKDGQMLIGMERRSVLSEELNAFIDGIPGDRTWSGEITLNDISYLLRGVFMKYPDQEGIIVTLDRKE